MEIVTSRHSVVRMRERYPHVKHPEKTIKHEVADAIEAGRRSKTKPIWASTFGKVKGTGSIRYVWPENLSRCYVIARKRVNGKSGWMVVSTLARGNPEMLERALLVKGEPKQTRTGPHAPKGERDPKFKPGMEKLAE